MAYLVVVPSLQRKQLLRAHDSSRMTLHYLIEMLNSSMLPKYWSSPSSFRPMVTGLVLVIDPIVMSLVTWRRPPSGRPFSWS